MKLYNLKSIQKETLLFIIFVNLLPLLGVLFLNWDSLFLLLAYWFETMILGVAVIIHHARKRDLFSVFLYSILFAFTIVPISAIMAQFIGLTVVESVYQFNLNFLVAIFGLFLYVITVTFLDIKISSLRSTPPTRPHLKDPGLLKRVAVIYFTLILAAILIKSSNNITAIAFTLVSVKLFFDIKYRSIE